MQLRNGVLSQRVRSAKFQAEVAYDKRVFAENSKLKLSHHFSDNFKPSLIFNSEESFNFRTVKKVVSQRSKKRQKISEFSQKTRIKISNAILVADFKCFLKLSTAGNLNFRGCLIRLREQVSPTNEFATQTRIKLSNAISVAEFKCSLFCDSERIVKFGNCRKCNFVMKCFRNEYASRRLAIEVSSGSCNK